MNAGNGERELLGPLPWSHQAAHPTSDAAPMAAPIPASALRNLSDVYLKPSSAAAPPGQLRVLVVTAVNKGDLPRGRIVFSADRLEAVFPSLAGFRGYGNVSLGFRVGNGILGPLKLTACLLALLAIFERRGAVCRVAIIATAEQFSS